MEPTNNSPQQPPTNPELPPFAPTSPPAPAPSIPSPTPQETPSQPQAPALQPTPPQNLEDEAVPSSWPGAFGVYTYSKRAIKVNLSTVIILILLGVLFGGFSVYKKSYGAGDAASLIIGSLFSGSLTLTILAGLRRQKLGIGAALSKGFSFWLKLIGLTVLVDLSYIVSFALLIVPFFFVLPRLLLANYFLVDKNLGVIEAYKASWHAKKVTPQSYGAYSR